MDRNNALRRKLASRRGTSITFALLLFLVCTVIGVIVVVAATAAAGRVSRLAVSDARFYAVQSAAQLLRQEIEAQTVTIERKAEEPYTETVIKYTDGTIWRTWDKDNVTGTTYTGSLIAASDYGFLDKAALCRVFDSPSFPTSFTSALWGRSPGSSVTPIDIQTLTMKLSDTTNNGLTSLPVEVTVKVNDKGDLILTLSATETETYTVTMTFTVVDICVDTPAVQPADEKPNLVDPGAQMSESSSSTVKLNSVKTDTVRWKLSGMK